jgi:hypothetical protein
VVLPGDVRRAKMPAAFPVARAIEPPASPVKIHLCIAELIAVMARYV